MRAGKDVVIASETGSGKTLAYLLPLLHDLLQDNNANNNSPTGNESITCPHTFSSLCSRPLAVCMSIYTCSIRLLLSSGGKPFPRALLILPNRELAQQTSSVLSRLLKEMGSPTTTQNANRHETITHETIVGLQTASLTKRADILICTPASAHMQFVQQLKMNTLDQAKIERMISSIKFVVVDEADMLFTSYIDQMTEILMYLRGEAQERWHSNRTSNHKKKSQNEKRYIFVGATIPDKGTKSVQQYLKYHFPSLQWAKTDYFHSNNPTLEHLWIKVNADKDDDLDNETEINNLKNRILVDVLKEHERNALTSDRSGIEHQNEEPSSVNKITKSIVFVNKTSTAKAVSEMLVSSGFSSTFGFHSDVSSEERCQILQQFAMEAHNNNPTAATGSSAGSHLILVCSDLASRGIDFKQVRNLSLSLSLSLLCWCIYFLASSSLFPKVAHFEQHTQYVYL